MRSHIRTIVALALVVGLLALFLHNVALWRVAAEIVRARPQWLALSLATMLANLAIRAWRWQFLLEPLGRPSFASAFRATAVGFAATSVLPARAGEVIRPYFLARTERHHEKMTATGAFATIILERVLDTITVLILLASFVFVFGREHSASSPVAFTAVKWAGALAGFAAASALVVLFFLAGDPGRLGRIMLRLEKVVPSVLAGLLAKVAEKFAHGLGAIRRPSRLLRRPRRARCTNGTAVQKKILGRDRVQIAYVSAISQDATYTAQQQIGDLLRQRHKLTSNEPDDFTVRNMTDVAEAANETSKTMTILLACIAGVSLLVGGIGIMNIMLVSVTERTREIGIRMAIGARSSAVRTQFLIESIVLSLTGGTIGIILGVALSLAIPAFLGWPTLVSMMAIIGSVLFSAAVGIFFGYYPARKAAALDPIEALRYE